MGSFPKEMLRGPSGRVTEGTRPEKGSLESGVGSASVQVWPGSGKEWSGPAAHRELTRSQSGRREQCVLLGGAGVRKTLGFCQET